MAFKHHAHHWFTIVRRIRVWQLLLLLVLFSVSSVYFLRQNNLGMVDLRNAVKEADENNGDTKTALLNLQRYVTSHMNASLGDGIVLQSSYKRAYDAAVQQALSVSNPTSEVYTQVELECRPVFKRTHSFPAYTQCAHDKLSALTPGQDALSKLTTPPTDLFRYNYLSPLWSPDLAGFSVLLAALAGLLLVGRVVTYLTLRAILRSHQ